MAEQPLEVHLATVSCHDSANDSIRLIRARWVGGASVVLATAFCVHALRVPLPEYALYLTGTGILLYNAILAWFVRRNLRADSPLPLRSIHRIVNLQILLDCLSISALLYLTGSIDSPLIPILLGYILLVATLLPGWIPYAYTGLGVGGLALIAVLEWMGLLPHYAIIPTYPSGLYANLAYFATRLLWVAITALAIVYLTGKLTARLCQRDRWVAALMQTLQIASSTLALPDLLGHLARCATEGLSASGASIRALDELGEELKVLAAYGLSQAYLEKEHFELSGGVLNRHLFAGHPVTVHEVAKDPRIRYPWVLTEAGYHSILAAPIMGRGKPLGVLCIYAAQPHRFTALDADLVMAIARQSAIILEHAQTCNDLQKADQTRAQFVRMVTHELRAPVGGAQSLLRTLLRGLTGELSERQHELLGRVEERLNQLMALINDLLALAASKTVDLQESPKRLPLQSALRQVVDQLTPEAESKKIELVTDLPFETLSVLATEEGLLRIFSNLIGNAIKYTPPGGRVCVQVVERTTEVAISISDTGIGIPEEDLPQLWNDFFRARNARRSGIVGTGLGLSIVRQLVERFGGTIGVRSSEGKGTTFKVNLPRAGPGDEALPWQSEGT